MIKIDDEATFKQIQDDRIRELLNESKETALDCWIDDHKLTLLNDFIESKGLEEEFRDFCIQDYHDSN